MQPQKKSDLDIPLTEKTFNALFLECVNMLYHLGGRLFNHHKEDVEEFVQDIYLYSFSKKKNF